MNRGAQWCVAVFIGVLKIIDEYVVCTEVYGGV